MVFNASGKYYAEMSSNHSFNGTGTNCSTHVFFTDPDHIVIWVGLFVTIINLLVFHRIRNFYPSVILYISMTLSSILFCFASIGARISHIIADEWYNAYNPTNLLATTLSVLIYASGQIFITILTILSIDRWIAVELPFMYARLVTQKKMLIINVVVWVYSVACMSGFLFHEPSLMRQNCRLNITAFDAARHWYTILLTYSVFGLSILGILCTQIRLGWIAFRAKYVQYRIHRQLHPLDRDNIGESSSEQIYRNAGRILLLFRKTALVVSAHVLLAIVTQVPIWQLFSMPRSGFGQSAELAHLAVVLLDSKHMLMFPLYLLTYPDYRKGFFKIIKSMRRCYVP